jgi:hypothetical protein
MALTAQRWDHVNTPTETKTRLCNTFISSRLNGYCKDAFAACGVRTDYTCSTPVPCLCRHPGGTVSIMSTILNQGQKKRILPKGSSITTLLGDPTKAASRVTRSVSIRATNSTCCRLHREHFGTMRMHALLQLQGTAWKGPDSAQLCEQVRNMEPPCLFNTR